METRIIEAGHCLRALSVGDAFGDQLFCDAQGHTYDYQRILELHHSGALPDGPWAFTDDTIMAATLLGHLKNFGRVEQGPLALAFAESYQKDTERGYGATVRTILRSISQGGSWQEASQRVFSGMGSMGNGAAMRVAPLGVYFAGD